MKRFHVHVHVADLEASVRFYSGLFGLPPEIRKPDYAKWMLEDPRLNFAVSTGGTAQGVSHLGLQVDGSDELASIAAQAGVVDPHGVAEPDAACCYARSDKHWFTDPQGIAWEVFHTTGAGDSLGCRRTAPAQSACCG